MSKLKVNQIENSQNSIELSSTSPQPLQTSTPGLIGGPQDPNSAFIGQEDLLSNPNQV